jgi:hypothetical protein
MKQSNSGSVEARVLLSIALACVAAEQGGCGSDGDPAGNTSAGAAGSGTGGSVGAVDAAGGSSGGLDGSLGAGGTSGSAGVGGSAGAGTGGETGGSGGSAGSQCTATQIGVFGRSEAGLEGAVSNGVDGFSTVSRWQSDYSNSNNWDDSPSAWGSIQFPDLNSDGKADVCGRDSGGIRCALSNGAAFGPTGIWSNNYSDLNGWGDGPEYYRTIQFPDVNGDGRDDVCGRGRGGIVCAASNGNGFEQATQVTTEFGDQGFWNATPSFWATIQFPDLNGDGKADVCGRAEVGIVCAIWTGAGFGTVTTWSSHYSDQNGWAAGPEYYGTIQFPDVNGDGRDDVCGRDDNGIVCASSNGATAFNTATLVQPGFSDASFWNGAQHLWGTIQFPDVNGDGKADVCGRHSAGIDCAVWTGASFSALAHWTDYFSNWDSDPSYWATIQFPDVNSDGKADVCGRGLDGIMCGLSSGTAFGSVTRWQSQFGDAGFWNSADSFWGTIQFPLVLRGTCTPEVAETPRLRPVQRFTL